MTGGNSVKLPVSELQNRYYVHKPLDKVMDYIMNPLTCADDVNLSTWTALKKLASKYTCPVMYDSSSKDWIPAEYGSKSLTSIRPFVTTGTIPVEYAKNSLGNLCAAIRRQTGAQSQYDPATLAEFQLFSQRAWTYLEPKIIQA